jgi:hypothetical protein
MLATYTKEEEEEASDQAMDSETRIVQHHGSETRI